jgi:hypothetical protein
MLVPRSTRRFSPRSVLSAATRRSDDADVGEEQRPVLKLQATAQLDIVEERTIPYDGMLAALTREP